MTTYESLVAQHDSLHQQLADDPNSTEIDRVRQLIAETSAAGREVADIPQRQQLRAILRHWGKYIHERTGEYPNTHLLPYAPPAAENEIPSALVPVPSQPTTPPTNTTTDRPRWFWPVLAGVLVVAILLALLASAAWNRLNRTAADTSTPMPLASPSTALLPGVEGDSDQDGLSDQQEALLGTEASNPDTDGDGLLDGQETLVYGTNPAALDSDGDGIPDGSEIAEGTSPTDPDSVSAEGSNLTPTTPITVTETITVTATPTLPAGPVLIVTAPEGQPSVAIRIGPGDQFAPLRDVPVGTAVLILRRTPDNSWYAVELTDHTSGWLAVTYATIPETTDVAAVPTFVPPQQ